MSNTDKIAVVDTAAEKAARRDANVRYIFKNAVLPGLAIGAAALIAIAVTSRSGNDDVSE